MAEAKRISETAYWHRIFMPSIFLLVVFAIYLLFLLPQTQYISTPSVFRGIYATNSMKFPGKI
jgi:hypothetical protein